jgi:hypothetical protein
MQLGIYNSRIPKTLQRNSSPSQYAGVTSWHIPPTPNSPFQTPLLLTFLQSIKNNHVTFNHSHHTAILQFLNQFIPTATMPLLLKLITSSTSYPSLALIKYHAFASNTLNQLMYPPSVSPQALQEWFIEREKRDARSPFQSIVAVVDTERGGEIVAYAKWELPSSLLGEVDHAVDIGPVPPVPEGANAEIWKLFREGVDGMREKWGDKADTFGKSRSHNSISPFHFSIPSDTFAFPQSLNSTPQILIILRTPLPSHAPLAPRPWLRRSSSPLGNRTSGCGGQKMLSGIHTRCVCRLPEIWVGES